MFWFLADEHLGHGNIIKYCNRPFSSVEEMDNTIIENHNSVVRPNDTVVHAGDFTLSKRNVALQYIKRLTGNHVFLIGSHDYWLGSDDKAYAIWQTRIAKIPITVCHYAMRVWPRSHYNSWHLYGHSHGMLKPEGKSWDVGVDNNDFYPVSFDQLVEIMKNRPDNFNLVQR